MLKTFSILFIVLVLSSLACVYSAASSSSPAPGTPTQETEPAITASLTLSPIATARARSCTVTAQEALNLRNGAGISFVVIGWLLPGEQLTLTNEPARGSWIQVTTESNLTGWINSTYCKVKP